MGPEFGEPLEYGRLIRYLEVEDVAPLVIVYVLSLLFTVLWLTVVIRYLRRRSKDFDGA